MDDQELNKYVKDLVQKKESNDDDIIQFLLNSLVKNFLDLQESNQAVENIKQQSDKLQKLHIGLLSTRLAYINDIKNRVREIIQTKGEEEE